MEQHQLKGEARAWESHNKKEREKNEKSKRERAVLKKAEGHSSTLFDPSPVSLEEVEMYTPVCYSDHWVSHSFAVLTFPVTCSHDAKIKNNTFLSITFHFRGDLSPLPTSCPNLQGGLIKWRHLPNEKYPEVQWSLLFFLFYTNYSTTCLHNEWWKSNSVVDDISHMSIRLLQSWLNPLISGSLLETDKIFGWMVVISHHVLLCMCLQLLSSLKGTQNRRNVFNFTRDIWLIQL